MIPQQSIPLSQSLLWKLQRNFYNRWGVDAWRMGIVPHYITSNPFVAGAYARLALGFLRDWRSAPGTFYNLGMCHYRLGQLDPALEYAELAMALDPEFEAAQTLRAKVQARLAERESK